MSDFNDQIIADFRANGGYVGAPFHSNDLVLLQTIGAKSGVARVIPLLSFPDDEGWVIVASKGGAPENPGWYYNLIAHPDVEIEFGTETIPVRASVIGEAERAERWVGITTSNPGFAEYEKTAGRVIPLVRLARR